MLSDLTNILEISSSGMQAQGTRMRVIAENIANSDSVAQTPGGLPYARKTVTFATELDKTLGIEKTKIESINQNTNVDFELKYEPDNPAANEAGYIRTPNVNTMLEIMDMRESQRTYEANLGIMEQARSMIGRTIDLLRV